MPDFQFKLHHYLLLPSTMDKAAELLTSAIQIPEFEPYVVMADQQTRGRGRLDRTWISPLGNFYATYVIKNAVPAQFSGLYAITAAVSVALCFEAMGIVVQLKWPNDIFLSRKKLGGILIEVIDAQYFMIGIGINLVSSPDQKIIKPSTCVQHDTGISLSPQAIHAVLQNQLWLNFNNLKQGYSNIIIQQWQKYCLHHQQMVSVRHNILISEGNTDFQGLYQGLDSSGALILKDTKTGKHQLIYVGDVL